MTLSALLVYGLMAGLSWLGMAYLGRLAWFGADPESWLGRRGLAADGLGNVGLGILLALVIAELSQHLSRLKWGRYLEDRIRDLLQGLTPRQAVVLALTSGIGEEMLFRGAVWGLLEDRVGVGATWAITSVLFGAVHVGPDRRFLLWTAFALVMGVFLGGLLLLSGSLVLPITVHVTVNGLNLLMETWQRRMFPDHPSTRLAQSPGHR